MELLWWVFTFLVAWVVVNPMWMPFVKYDFIYDCIFNVIIFITFARYVLFLKYTFLAKFQIGKFILIFACIPLGFYTIQEIFAYQDFLDNEGTAEFLDFFRPDIGTNALYEILDYTTQQILFFGVAAAISVIILPFRLLVSFWRVYNNTGTV